MEWETSRMAEDGEVEARQVCPHAFYSERDIQMIIDCVSSGNQF